MFHVLVFDPDSAYIFWELSPERLALLREEVGGQRWLARKLAVRACVPGGRTLVQELYGDRGSYFLRVNAPGETVAFELGFAVAGGFHCTGLGRAVSFPRISESPDASVRVLRVALTEEPLTVQEEAPEAAYGRPPVPLSERHRKWPPAKPAYGTPSSAERLKRHD